MSDEHGQAVAERDATEPAPATSTSSSSTSRSEPPTAPQQERPPLVIDDSRAALCYANFCRVTGTPEELILDFALNANPIGLPERVEVKQRLIVNFFTAKRMVDALSMAVQRHEAAFGVLETDVQKRVVGRRAARPAGAPR